MFQKLREWLSLKNYQYQVTTGIYMLEPWERTIFTLAIFEITVLQLEVFVKHTNFMWSKRDTTLVTILGMSVYTTYAYLPAYIYNVLAYFGYVEGS